LTEKARELGISAGALKTWLNRITDVLVRENGIFKIHDQALKLWLKNRSVFKKILPPTILGDEAEKLVARELASYGFQMIYQSRASRSAFDLLGIAGIQKIGVQVKKGHYPFYIKKAEINEMQFWGKLLGWHPLLALVDNDQCKFYSVKKTKIRGRTLKIDLRTKSMENILGEV
jgi:Holliday junction resolvase